MNSYKNKKILILGFGRQGKAMAKFAAEKGAIVHVSDIRPRTAFDQSIQEYEKQNICFHFNNQEPELINGFDLLCLSAGIPSDIPIVQKAVNTGITLTNDSLEFITHCPAKFTVGITGSAGKSTTATLTSLLCKASGVKTWLGGNIGNPLLNVINQISVDDLVIQELSSFQLELWNKSPDIAVVLSVFPDHLIRHKTMSSYLATKSNILSFQNPKDLAILNFDDAQYDYFREKVHGELLVFSLHKHALNGAYVSNDYIWLRIQNRNFKVCRISKIKLRGMHNIYNILAAILVSTHLGLDPEEAAKIAINFKGIPHRLEQVGILNGATFINDSISTNPFRSIAGLKSLNEPIILLAGGKDDDQEWEEWLSWVKQKSKFIILFGELSGKLYNLLRSNINFHERIIVVKNLKEAIEAAIKICQPGDIVLFSPGGTSFDEFNNFEQRGQFFSRSVMEYINEKNIK